MRAAANPSTDPTLAKTLAPEDIVRGDYVALLSESQDYPLLVWLFDVMPAQQSEVVRLKQHTDLCRDPLRVLDVCLPFVFVERPNREHITLDLRCCELARLDRGYARRVWRALKPKKAAEKRKKGKK